MKTCAANSDPTGKLWESICDNWLLAHMKNVDDKKERAERVRERMRGSAKHKWITISLPKVMFDPHKAIDALVNCRFDYMKEALFCLEVTGINGEFHPHFHILILGCPDNTRMIRDFSNLFGLAKNFVDIGIRNYDLYQTRLDYVRGIKQEKKMSQVEADCKYLQENNLEKYYLHI